MDTNSNLDYFPFLISESSESSIPSSSFSNDTTLSNLPTSDEYTKVNEKPWISALEMNTHKPEPTKFISSLSPNLPSKSASDNKSEYKPSAENDITETSLLLKNQHKTK